MAFATGDIFTDLLRVVLALLVIAVAYFKWSFTYWKRKGVEQLPPSIPCGNVGNVLLQKITLGEMLQDMYNKCKIKGARYYGFYFFSRPALVLIELDLIKTIMTKDFQHFTDHGQYVNEEKEPLTGNLFSLKGSKWRFMRAKLTPTFTSGKMKMMFHTLVDCSRGLLEVMDQAVENREALDIKDTMARYTTDVIGSCAFGLDCNSLKNPNSEFRQYGKKVFELGKIRMVLSFVSSTFPRIMDKFRYSILNKDLTNFILNIVKQTVEYRERNNIVRKDFMQLLIHLKNNVDIRDEEKPEKSINNGESPASYNNVGKTLSMNEIAAQAFVFFVAGFETSSTTLTFCFYELATHSQIQEKLRKEINSVLEKHNGELTYDAMMEMQYMDKCVQETLRKYPPAAILMRECTKTYRIPDTDVVVEKGVRALLPILGIHRHPEYYPEPEKFDPERFSPQNKAKRHPFTWIPFGEGPRACIGLRFGWMQIKVALIVLLKRYKFTLSPKTRTPLGFKRGSFILSFEGDVLLDVEKIDA